MCFHVTHSGQISKQLGQEVMRTMFLAAGMSVQCRVDRVNHLMMSRNSQDPLLSGCSANFNKMKLTFNVNPGSDFSISGP